MDKGTTFNLIREELSARTTASIKLYLDRDNCDQEAIFHLHYRAFDFEGEQQGDQTVEYLGWSELLEDNMELADRDIYGFLYNVGGESYGDLALFPAVRLAVDVCRRARNIVDRLGKRVFFGEKEIPYNTSDIEKILLIGEQRRTLDSPINKKE